jgi:hypothetical protein
MIPKGPVPVPPATVTGIGAVVGRAAALSKKEVPRLVVLIGASVEKAEITGKYLIEVGGVVAGVKANSILSRNSTRMGSSAVASTTTLPILAAKPTLAVAVPCGSKNGSVPANTPPKPTAASTASSVIGFNTLAVAVIVCVTPVCAIAAVAMPITRAVSNIDLKIVFMFFCLNFCLLNFCFVSCF